MRSIKLRKHDKSTKTANGMALKKMVTVVMTKSLPTVLRAAMTMTVKMRMARKRISW